MKASIYYILFIANIILFACQKDKIAIRDYPRIDINNEVKQNESGVTFSASVISAGELPVIEKGFCWSSIEMPSIELSHISIDDNGSIGPFEATATIDFIPNTLYRVCAFVKTKETIVYSKEIEFACTFNSPELVLNDFSPKEAAWGDTVTISGENLSFLSSNSKVSFGQTKASITSFSDTQLKVLVPELSNLPEVELSVTIIGKSKSFNDKFKYIQPEVLDFFPKDLYNNDTLTIIGKDFHPNSAYCNVIIEGLGCRIISNSSTEIKAIITIGNNDPEVSIIDTFKITVFSGGKTLKANGELAFNFHSRWTKKKDYPGLSRSYGVAFGYDNKGYFGLGSDGYLIAYQDFWKFDPALNNWYQIASFPGQGRFNPTFFELNGKFYVCCGKISDTYLNDIWQFDPGTESWKQLNNFPGKNRCMAFGFSINGKAYLGYGKSATGSIYDLWMYEPELDKWTLLGSLASLSLDYNKQGSIGFSLNGFGYLLGSDEGDSRMCYKYDPNANTWTKIKNMPKWLINVTGFSLSDNLYVGIGGGYSNTTFLNKYEPRLDSWTSIIFKGNAQFETSSFVIGNKGYIVGGWKNNPYSSLSDLWEFDPSK